MPAPSRRRFLQTAALSAATCPLTLGATEPKHAFSISLAQYSLHRRIWRHEGESLKRMGDGLRRLCEKAEPLKLNVLVENEAGFGADADWLVDLMTTVDHPLAGLLPDFGNFWIDAGSGELYDPYVGTAKMMAFAKAVSAKSFGFDSPDTFVSHDRREGRELSLDFERLLRIVRDAGYRGHVGIEYEGPSPEMEGIRQTKAVLQKLATA